MMKTIIYAKTAQTAKRARRPKTGETVGYRSFEEFKGEAEKGFTKCEIIGDDLSQEQRQDIHNAYRPKTKKKDE